LFLKIPFKDIENPGDNIRDVSKIGHFGTGDTEIVVANSNELNQVKPLIEKSYNLS